MKNINTVRVKLWGTTVGYLHQDENRLVGFQYDEDFLKSNIEISPVKMPLSAVTYSFPSLHEQTFHGLPGMVADSLPDKFGNIVIKNYLESQGRTEDSLSVIEKLCYTGKRGMGALEYEPSQEIVSANEKVDLDALTKLASDILSEKEKVHFEKNDSLMAQLMECGSSVGGARAKTLIAWNPETNDIRSGQIEAGKGYEYWLLKFDNIKNNKDKICDLLIGTDLNSGGLQDCDKAKKIALIIGNEGNGVSKDLLLITDKNVTLKMANEVESLNAGVAGSILMYNIFN